MKKVLSVVIIILSLMPGLSVKAEVVKNNIAEEIIDEDPEQLEDSYSSSSKNGSLDNYQGDAGYFINAMSDSADNMKITTDTESIRNVSKKASLISKTFVQFAIAIIPAGMLMTTVLEFTLLCLTPLRSLYDKTVGSQSESRTGGLDSGTSKKQGFTFLSEDYYTALEEYNSGGSGMSSLDGGSGKKDKGLSEILKTFSKKKIKTVIVCTICMSLTLTPVVFDFSIILAQYLFKILGQITGWLGGGI